MFLYPQEGETDGARTLAAQDYFTRLARRSVALLEEVTGDGFVYRVDTRLRPFGDSGPVVASFSALESYLGNHGLVQLGALRVRKGTRDYAATG
ncbi:MAG: hypothetical protein U5K38_07945 [Woeseiaceae bacterium]|nr:hypothetical protein [Woeseiaceae bacterium]